MKQVKLILITISVLVLISFSGCTRPKDTSGNNRTDTTEDTTTIPTEDNTTTTESDTTAPTQDSTTAPTEEMSTEDTTTSTEEPVTTPSISYDEIAALDPTKITYGPGVHMDEWNRPWAAVNNQNAYGSYDAYFVKLDSNEIYLTFDLGYEYNGNTPKILDVLKEKNVKAVFFPTLPFIQQHPEIIQRIIDEGHVLGNHSVTHPSMPTVSIEQMESEIMTLHNYVYENFNYKTTLFRPPQGHFSYQSLALTQNVNHKTVLWSFAYADYYTDNQPDVAWALENALQKAHPGAIYLLHSVSDTNVAMLGDLIDGLEECGYSIGLLQ